MLGLGLGLGLGKGSGAVAFNPASFFGGGEKGVIYDPSDLTSLFQDSAGTTPVTASADPVGKMNDLSGNNFHATQATGGSRPSYQVASGKKSVRVLAGGFNLGVPTISAAAADWTLVVGIKLIAVGTYQCVLDAQTGRLIFYAVDSTATSASYYDGGYKVASWTPGTTAHTLTYALTSGAGKIRADGADILTGQAYTQRAISGVTALGTNIVGGDGLNGDIYGLILINRVLTAGEIANAEAWMAARI